MHELVHGDQRLRVSKVSVVAVVKRLVRLFTAQGLADEPCAASSTRTL